MQQLDPSDEARARAFIKQMDWRFTVAKTVPDAPHAYIARAWLKPEQQREFDWVAEWIDRTGYKGKFWNATWRYWDLAPYKYWPSMSWVGQDARVPRTMLNRARLDQGQQRLEVE
jgi:hypothetical protein